MLSARADSRKRLESGVTMRQDVGHKFGPQKGQVHAVDRSFDAVTSSSTKTPHKTYSQVAPNPQILIKPMLGLDTVKPSKPMQKARSAALPTKRTGPTGVSKTGAKGSIEMETASSVEVARAKAPRAREGGGSGSTSKSSVGAKETMNVEIEETNIDITPHKKAGDAVTKVGGVVKQETDVTEVSSTESKVKATGVAKRRTGKPLIAGEPRWTVTKPQTTASWKTERLPGRIPASELKPAVWSSSKEELLLALPELAKPTNGVAWLMAEAPVLVLEDRDIGLSVSNVGLNGALSMELRMARDFACTPSDLLPPPPDLQNSPRDARAFRGARSSHKKSSTVSSGNASGHAFVSDSQKSPNHRRPPPSSPRKTGQGVYIVDSAKAPKVPKIEFNFDSLIVMAPESNNEGPLAVRESEVTNQAPTVARTLDSHPTNTDSGRQESYGTFHDASHPRYLAHASEQSTPQGPASSLSLKRGPEAPGQAAEVPPKRIKMEPTESSVWAPSIPGLNSQRSQQTLPFHGKPDADQTIQGRSHTTTQRSFGPGSSKTDVSTPLIHHAGLSSSTLMPHTPASNSSMASTQPTKPLFSALPRGLKFNKKPKVDAQGSSVQDENGEHLPKPPSTPSPDLPFGKPFHQQSFITKDEPQEEIIPGPSLPSPQEKASDRRFPFTLPSEVQVMLDAYVSGRAVVAIASRAVLLQHWNISLPCEFAYAFLGFFRVRRVWETQVAGPQGHISLTDDHITGQVEWRFRCDWEPSADEVIASESFRCVPQPWWVPGSRRQDKGKGRAMTNGDEDTDTESSVQYRMSRKMHHNYQYRRISLSQSYQSVLPRHVRAPDTPNMPDEAFPLGWLCENCGKLNYRVMLRHRTCTSSFCKDKPSPPSYALSLEQLREPQQGSPISHPYDAYPKGVEAHFAKWGDGMRTYTYVVAGDKDEGVTVKHIFTCNSEALQVEATKLLELFQLHIPMQRKIGKTTIPYFEYVISSTPGALQSPATTWESAPPCAMWAKETLLYHGQGYGEKRNLIINKLSVLAWVTSGTRKGPSSPQSKANSIIIMCLGADAVISVTPKSGFPSLNTLSAAVDSNTAMLVDDEDTHPDPASKDEDDPMQDGDLDAEADIISPDAPKPARASTKPPKPSISTTLVHGDAIILSGDDFEYSIKRSGTSILLIGSCVTA